MAHNIKGSDVIPSKDRVGGLERSDEEIQRASESGVGHSADEKRAADDVDPETGKVRAHGAAPPREETSEAAAQGKPDTKRPPQGSRS